ncbi:MAG: hypothetical protein RL330_229 [Actinomycetota bacterium]
MRYRSRSEASSPRRREGILVLASAAAGPLVSVLSTPLDRGYTWDEAVYVARATLNDNWRHLWGPARMTGMPLVLSPVTAVTDNVVMMRLWLAMVGVMLALVAVRLWSRLVGTAAPAAFLLLAISWQVGWFSTTGYPNWFTGLLILGLCGWTVLSVEGEPVSSWAGFFLAFLAMQMRWTDVIVAWAGVLVWLVMADPTIRSRGWSQEFRKRSTALASRILPALTGAGVSLVLWVVESEMYFGSAWQRLSFLRDVEEWERFSAAQYGQLLWFYGDMPDGRGVLNWLPLAFLVAVVVLAILGLRLPPSGARRAVSAAAWGSVALGLLYLTSPGDSLRRFIIPCLVLAAVPAGAGWVRAWTLFRRGVPGARAMSAVLVVLLITGAVGNAALLHHLGDREGGRGTEYASLAARMEEIAEESECTFLSVYSFPQIQIGTHCLGDRRRFDKEWSEPDDDLLGGRLSFLASPIDPSPAWLAAGWLLDSRHGGWGLWVRDGRD